MKIRSWPGKESGGKVFQAEGTAYAKDMRQKRT